MLKIKEIFYTKSEKRKQDDINKKYNNQSKIVNEIIDILLDDLSIRTHLKNASYSFQFENGWIIKFGFETNIFGDQPRYNLKKIKYLGDDWVRTKFSYRSGEIFKAASFMNWVNTNEISGLENNGIFEILNSFKSMLRENRDISNDIYIKLRKTINKYESIFCNN